MCDISQKRVRLSAFSDNAHETQFVDLKYGLSECLDKLGYSRAMISYRRNTNSSMDAIYNRKAYPFHSITTGSKAEGTALYFESDIDRMFEVKGVICVDSDESKSCPVVVTLVREGCAPGYTRLKLRSENDQNNVLGKYLVSEEDGLYISNDFTGTELYLTDINGITITKQDKAGPSMRFGNSEIVYDFVYGFKCISQDQIEKWIARPRLYGWPDAELLKNIASLYGSVVPVANKETRYPRTEWRICYTRAEILLMESLNEFQTKLYILLKHIAKSVLKPICSEMSSYIMKNILFWMVETNPKEFFAGSNLIDRLTDGIVFLKECLYMKTLNSFMIEDRNLLQGRVTDKGRNALIKELELLINEKENMLRRCDKIWSGFVRLKRNPHQFTEEAARRDKIEQLVLQKNIVFKDEEKPEVTTSLLSRLQCNDMYKKYDEELHKLVLPDRDRIATSGQNPEQVFRNRLSTILS